MRLKSAEVLSEPNRLVVKPSCNLIRWVIHIRNFFYYVRSFSHCHYPDFLRSTIKITDVSHVRRKYSYWVILSNDPTFITQRRDSILFIKREC